MRTDPMALLQLACFALLVTNLQAATPIPEDSVEIITPDTPIETPPSHPPTPPSPTVLPPVASPPDVPSPAVSPSSPAGEDSPTIFWDEFYTFFGDKHVKFSGSPTGAAVSLALDNTTGSGFRSKYPYLYGHLSMKLKLVGGNSAGTVTSYYLASIYEKWCELDFEFLGNVSGEPYILQTNVFSEGVGNREQRTYLWFDPTTEYHSYGILWNEKLILFLVDDVVIRVFHNVAYLGIPYLTYQPMYIYTSIWNGENWATRGGADKTDWTQQPFVASYTDFDVEDSCKVKGENHDEVTHCQDLLKTASFNAADKWVLTDSQIADLKRIKTNYTIYDYCSDTKRFNSTPVECPINWPFDY